MNYISDFDNIIEKIFYLLLILLLINDRSKYHFLKKFI